MAQRKRLLKTCRLTAHNIRQAHSDDPETAAMEAECLAQIERLQNRLMGVSPAAEKSTAALPNASQADARLYTMAVALRMQDALCLYDVALSAAGSFALLVADNIKYCEHYNAGWEDFASHTHFHTGVNELARMALSNATAQLDETHKVYAPIIERLRAFTGPLELVTLQGDALSKAYDRYCGKDHPNLDLETAVRSLQYLIEVLTLTLSERSRRNALSYKMGQIVKREFETAFSALFTAMHDVQRATMAIGLQSEQRQEVA